MQKVHPVTYRIAEGEREKVQAVRLIKQVFVHELGYVDIRPDEFDSVAIFIIATTDDRIIATVRMVLDSEAGLPLDSFTDISSIRGKGRKLAELSRLACLNDYRANRVAANGIGFIKEIALSTGVTHLLIDSFLHTAPLYKRLGFKSLGGPIFDPTVCKNGYNSMAPNAQVMIAEACELKGWLKIA